MCAAWLPWHASHWSSNGSSCSGPQMHAGWAAQTWRQSCLPARWLGCSMEAAAPGLHPQRCSSLSLLPAAAAPACAASGRMAAEQLTWRVRSRHGAV